MLLAADEKQHIIEQRSNIILVPKAAELQFLNNFAEQRFVFRQDPAVKHMLSSEIPVVGPEYFYHRCR